MKKILFISPRFCYPLIGGDRIKCFNTLKILSKYFEVHFVAIAHEKDADISAVEPFCKSIKIFYKNKLDSYKNALLSLISFEPLQSGYFYFKDVQNYVNEMLETQNFDLIYCTLIRTAKYAQKCKISESKLVKVLDMTDSLAISSARNAKNTKSLFWKIVQGIEARRLTKFEKYCVKYFDLSLFINQNEMDIYQPLGKCALLPHGVNEKLFELNFSNDKYKNAICFFGKMDYAPNIDAALWFAQKVMSKLDSEHFVFYIIGANPVQKILALESTNIKVLGFVENPYEILQSSLCMVAPMQNGGGIQNKILEALALGQVVLTNNLGANPIHNALNGKNMLIANDEQDFKEIILQLASGAINVQEIRRNTRALASAQYTWSAYERELLRHLEDVLD